MLKDEIEKIKKEDPDNLTLRLGNCRFCNQMAQFNAPAGWTRAECDEAATELCDCLEARMYSLTKKQKEGAKVAIESQFGGMVEERVIKLLIQITDLIAEGMIESSSLDLGGGQKAKASRTAKGFIKVERQKMEKRTQEV